MVLRYLGTVDNMILYFAMIYKMNLFLYDFQLFQSSFFTVILVCLNTETKML